MPVGRISLGARTTAGTIPQITIRGHKQQRRRYGQLIPICTKQEPHGPLVPTKALIKGGVTAWSLTWMSVPITRVLILIRDQPCHGVPRSEGRQRWPWRPLSLSIPHRNLESHQLVRLERQTCCRVVYGVLVLRGVRGVAGWG